MSNKRFRTAALAGAIAASALSQTANATPSGLIVNPSTDIYSKGTLHLDVDYNRFRLPGGPAAGSSSDDSLSVGLTYGLGPDNDKPFGRTELGFDVSPIRTGSGAGKLSFGDSLVFNIKTQLYNNPEQQIRLVTGLAGFGDGNSTRLGYLAVSKNFGDPGRVHLGVSRTFNDFPDVNAPATNKKYTQFQAAYEKLLSDKLLFLAEYNSGSGPFGTTGASLVYNLNDRSGVQLAYIRYNGGFVRRNIVKDGIYLAYDVNFGLRGAVSAPPPDPAADGEAKK